MSWTQTGVTRDDWGELLAELVIGLRRASNQDWDLVFPGEETSFWSRATLGIGAYLGAGGSPSVTFDGQRVDLRECFIRGADRMLTNPRGPRWVGSGAGKRLLNVEATYVVIGYWLGRKQLEASPLWTTERRERWVEQIRANMHAHPNTNYRTFDLAQQAAMRALGWHPCADEDYVDDWETVDREYIGQGFWNDQPNAYHCDAYSAMMVLFLHYFKLMNASVGSTFQAAAIERRIRDFFSHWHLLANSNGAIVPWGRSAHPAYHQHSALFAIGVDCYDFHPAGQAKRIANLWLRALRAHAVDPRGHYVRKVERPSASDESQEDYSRHSLATGSAIDHAGIVLAASERFWGAAEAPLAVEEGDYVAIWPETGIGLAGDSGTGRVFLVSNRTWSDRVSSNCCTKYNYRSCHSDFVQSTGVSQLSRLESPVPLLYGQPWVELADDPTPATLITPQASFLAIGAKALLSGIAGEAVKPLVKPSALEQTPAKVWLSLVTLAKGQDVVHVVSAFSQGPPLGSVWEYTLPIPIDSLEMPMSRDGDDWASLVRGNLAQFARLAVAPPGSALQPGARFGSIEDQLNRQGNDAQAIVCRVPGNRLRHLSYVLHTHYSTGPCLDDLGRLSQRVAVSRNDEEQTIVQLADELITLRPRGTASMTAGPFEAHAPTNSIFALSTLNDFTACGAGNCTVLMRSGEALVSLAAPGPVSLGLSRECTEVRLNGPAQITPSALPGSVGRILGRTAYGEWIDVTTRCQIGEFGIRLPRTVVRQFCFGLATFRCER